MNKSEQVSEGDDLCVRKTQWEDAMFDCVDVEQGDELFDARQVKCLTSARERIRCNFTRTRARCNLSGQINEPVIV